MIYLASLYASGAKSNYDLEVRYQKVLEVTAWLLKNGIKVFSPIVHNHPINKVLKEEPNWDFWGPYDLDILKRCDELWVLAEPMWEDSKGIAEEIKFAVENKIPIRYLKNKILYFSVFDIK